MGWSMARRVSLTKSDIKYEGNGFRKKKGLKTGFALGKEGFTDMKYEGNGFRKKGS